MNKNEMAMLIALIFLGIYSYGLYTVRNFSVSLPFLGEFSVSGSGEYLVFTGLALAFIIFWKVRREKTEDAGPSGD